MPVRSVYPLALLLSVAVVVSACDGFESGTPPNQVQEEVGTTVSFAVGEFASVEDDSTISIDVMINNPAGKEVSAEVLYADGISQTDASDFNLPRSAAVGENGFVAGSVTFPAGAEDGDTQSVDLVIADDEPDEDREEGIFVLQKVRNAKVGSTDRLGVTIGAITVLFADFSNNALAPMSAVSVASSEDWGISDAGGAPNAPVAAANGFGGSAPANDWLITPTFNFNQLEDETLSFLSEEGFDDGGLGQESLRLKVSTDYSGSGDPTDATWTDVSDRATLDDVADSFETPFGEPSGKVDLSDFDGDEVYVAFQYRSSGTGGGDAAEWQLDNITLTSSTPPQAGGGQ